MPSPAILVMAFSITLVSSAGSGVGDFTTSVSTFDGGSNPSHFQQQVVAILTIP